MRDGDVKIEFTPAPGGLGQRYTLCPNCLGSGTVRAKQLYMTYDAGPIRGPDTFIKCPSCNGHGIRRK